MLRRPLPLNGVYDRGSLTRTVDSAGGFIEWMESGVVRRRNEMETEGDVPPAAKGHDALWNPLLLPPKIWQRVLMQNESQPDAKALIYGLMRRADDLYAVYCVYRDHRKDSR